MRGRGRGSGSGREGCLIGMVDFILHRDMIACAHDMARGFPTDGCFDATRWNALIGYQNRLITSISYSRGNRNLGSVSV